MPDCIMHGIGDALLPGVLHWKPAAAVAGTSAPLPPVEDISMEPTSIEFAQIAHGDPCDEPGGARTGASDPVTPKYPMPQCAQARHSMRATRCMKAATDSITTGSGVTTTRVARRLKEGLKNVVG